MELQIVYNDGQKETQIEQIVKSIKWSGDIKQAARRLDLEMTNTADGRTRLFEIQKGHEVRLLKDGKELFRGIIFTDSINAAGQMSVTAYDENIYLTKNKDTKIFRDVTAGAIVKRLCNEFGIPAGQVADTGYVIKKHIFRDKTLFDMMVTALTTTEKQTGRRFFITSREGKLQLFERKEQKVKWMLENGANIMDASYSQSIEELRSQIKVIGSDEKKKGATAMAKDDELVKRFGTMQHLEKVDGDMTKSQMEQRAKQLLKDLGTIHDEARLEAIGIDGVTAGMAVYVKESLTGIIGGYYISTDEHTFENGKHTMSLSLSATDDLPELAYEEQGKGGSKR
ncbi:XkdQ/YqbQ family protein [Ectobacillus ponti]|uniref:YqbQ/XkdQ domain-containing protein n=1 Tax=Ectobacillus ponti TaxID=2961894 RepID=A0AA42BR49_9BACI|nr:hypothetical protein [Ectobacillus ponti]MCP8970046.1 hypothetical protein [Ectobacillus ponti]